MSLQASLAEKYRIEIFKAPKNHEFHLQAPRAIKNAIFSLHPPFKPIPKQSNMKAAVFSRENGEKIYCVAVLRNSISWRV